jgi:hypothetical protein
MSIFLNFFRKTIPKEDDILNAALKLKLDQRFGSQQSIREKLLSKFPFLTEDELIKCGQQCGTAATYGHELLYGTMVRRCKMCDPMTGKELMELYKNEMAKKFPWVNKPNLHTIYAQACYGLWHDGWRFKNEKG